MDTRFWGPSGWKLLHTITFVYNPENKVLMREFLETIPYILPCKFCRASLTDYYKELPYEIADDSPLDSQIGLARWMYNIHNCVNDKLRQQGLNPSKDPTFSDVQEFYINWLKESWENQLVTWWDFLFSVAYNHPKESTKHSKPMPNCPTSVKHCNDICEKNKWNVLGKRERLYWFKRFWDFLPAVLPLEIQKKWVEIQKNNKPILNCRRATIAWLWRMRCGLDSNFKDPFTSICKKIAIYSSECSKSLTVNTCRKQRQKYRKTKKISKSY